MCVRVWIFFKLIFHISTIYPLDPLHKSQSSPFCEVVGGQGKLNCHRHIVKADKGRKKIIWTWLQYGVFDTAKKDSCVHYCFRNLCVICQIIVRAVIQWSMWIFPMDRLHEFCRVELNYSSLLITVNTPCMYCIPCKWLETDLCKLTLVRGLRRSLFLAPCLRSCTHIIFVYMNIMI